MRYKTRNLKKQPPKKSATKRKTLITYKLPSTIYQKVLDELNDPSEKDHSVYSPAQIRQRCHQNIYSLFNTSEPVECNSNFLEAAKNSLEDRNFRVLYDIISKALDIRDAFLVQQLKQVSSYSGKFCEFFFNGPQYLSTWNMLFYWIPKLKTERK